MTSEDGDDENDAQRRRVRRRHHRTVLDLVSDDDVVEGNVEAAVRSITETAAETVDVTRVGVWLFEDDDRIRCIDHYDSRTDDHTAGTELVAAEYPSYLEALRTHRSISAVDARTDPRTRELSADYLEPQGIESMLDATLRDEGDVIGVVCHEQVGRTREWTDAEIQFAGDVADVVHRALRNRRSARQRQELEFRRSLLEAQQESMPDGVLVVDEDEEILSWNSRFRELWGLSSEMLERAHGDDLFEHIRDQVADPETFADRIIHLIENPTETSHDEIVLDDGRIIEVYSTPVQGETGHQYGRLWLTRDITERRRRQDELEVKNRAMDEAPVGITLSDPGEPDNPLIYANDRFEQLTGYDRDEALERNCRFLQGEGTAAEPVEELRAAVEAERPTTVELRNYRADGSEFWNRVTIAPVANEDGDVTNYVGFQQDVTERKEATRQLRVLHRVLRHNLANHLSIVRGTAEQLTDQLSGQPETAAETIVQETDRLLRVTDKHRSVVKLLSERPTPEPIDLEGVLQAVLYELRTAHPDAEVTLEGEPSATVTAIPAIETAFRELLANAIDHSEGTPPTVALRVDWRPETVRIRIVDDGPGLPAEERQILTGDQQVEPLYHGLGMGHWLVYWIVTLSEGTITVEDDASNGTAIHIELSRADD